MRCSFTCLQPDAPPPGATPGGGIVGHGGAPRVTGGPPATSLLGWRHYRLLYGMRAGMSARGGGLNPIGVLPRIPHADSTPPRPIVAQVQVSCTTRVQLVYNSYRTHTYNSSQKQMVFEHTHARSRKSLNINKFSQGQPLSSKTNCFCDEL